MAGTGCSGELRNMEVVLANPTNYGDQAKVTVNVPKDCTIGFFMGKAREALLEGGDPNHSLYVSHQWL